MKWEDLEQTLHLLAHVMRSPEGEEPIAEDPDTEKEATAWLERWIQTTKVEPLPEGKVRQACFARLYVAGTFVSNAIAHQIELSPSEFLRTTRADEMLRELLIRNWPMMAQKMREMRESS